MKPANNKPKFLADQMLGRLAKWLRILGFDTKYFNSIDDAELLRIAKEEDRILLTRDTQLLKRRPIVRNSISAIHVNSDDLINQLDQIINDVDLADLVAGTALSPLCIHCNWPIHEIQKDLARGRVPSYVYKTQHEFCLCPKCGRIYWKGTHWERIKEKLQAALDKKAHSKDNGEA